MVLTRGIPLLSRDAVACVWRYFEVPVFASASLSPIRCLCGRSAVKLQLQVQRGVSTMTSEKPVPEDVLLGIGNSLLDITVVTDAAFLHKYDLQANNAIIVDEKHKEIYNEMLTRFKPAFLPGGATQNSIRVAQWLLGKPRACTFFGSVGDDEFGKILKETAESVGVNVRYEVLKGWNTGRCGAIITGEDRSLVTELGAAEHFNSHYLEEPANWALVEKAKFYYIGGFFLPVSMDAVLKLVSHAMENNKTVIMNLHAIFLCKFFADKKLNLLQYVDVLFGNSDEATELANLMNFNTTDIKEIVRRISELPKANTAQNRTVVITQGRQPTIIAQSGEVNEYTVTPVDSTLIKDTNGCGDAFVGGFLSQLAQDKPLDECLRCGMYASSVVIQYFGCNYPEHPDFK